METSRRKERDCTRRNLVWYGERLRRILMSRIPSQTQRICTRPKVVNPIGLSVLYSSKPDTGSFNATSVSAVYRVSRIPLRTND